ncbi:MAG: hypothetical protein J6A61_05835 [Clostridia bacterium]|nr:hypothetical protein [Clostridia bacterium]
MSQKPDYSPQKNYLSKKKQLRVWLDSEKYEQLKSATQANGESIYSIINNFVDEYLKKNQ